MKISRPLSIYDYLKNLGYADLREIDGKVCGLKRLMFTTGVFINLDKTGYIGRVCFETWADAKRWLVEWDGRAPPVVGEDGCTADKYTMFIEEQ